MTFTPLLSISFSFVIITSLCDKKITISNESELIAFSEAVNNGTSYSGTTVFLNADINFSGAHSEKFRPIGYSNTRHFNGTFDGQGHTISNLVTNSSLRYVGLFGLSYGTTIQNVVIDDTCSVVSYYVSNEFHCIGSTLGYCYSSKGQCVIKNSVNMASITFKGNTTIDLFIGGFVGQLFSSSNNSNIIKNCVNYGTITHSGAGNNWVELGGIIGISDGSSYSRNYIQNCLNYGKIINNGTSSNLTIGGIVSFNFYSFIDNCVSLGSLVVNQESEYIGAIVGLMSYYAEVTHCYWTSDIGDFGMYGHRSISSVSNSSFVTLNQTTLNELNEYAAKNETWSKWFMVHLNGGNISNITQEFLVEIQRHIPDPVKEGNNFLFWCKDAKRTEKFDPKKDNITGITDLYAAWVNNTVTFDFGNGTITNFTFSYNTFIEYPANPEKEGYTFNGWDNKPNFMPASDITITAQWEEIPTQYVEVVFNTKDLSKEKIDEFISKYTDENYKIIEISKNVNGEVKVIVKFTDTAKAEDFARTIKGSRDTKSVSFIPTRNVNSFATSYYSMALLSIFI